MYMYIVHEVKKEEHVRCSKCRDTIDLSTESYHREVDSYGVSLFWHHECWHGPLLLLID